MGIKVECDVEGCDETHSAPGDRMGRSLPPGWSRLEMTKEVDDDTDEIGRRKARNMRGGPSSYVAGPPSASEIVGMSPRRLRNAFSLVICSKHKLPEFKKEAFEVEDFGYVPGN